MLVTTPFWTTAPIPFQRGVYQGDPLSVIIFNSVMSTLSEALRKFQCLGYTFSGSSRSVSVVQYADDTCLVADGPSSCQILLDSVESWLQWSGMEAQVPKCHSLASSGKMYDPKLTLQNSAISCIGNNAIKFLGASIQIPPNQNQLRKNLKSKLELLLEKVDEVPISRGQKLLLYKLGVCPRVLWDLGISDLPVSWISNHLEATTTRYLKKWSGLSKSADPSRLYLPKKNGGLDLPNITTLYKKIKVNSACQLLLLSDHITQQATKLQIRKEELQKRINFHPMLFAWEMVAADPGAGKKAIMTRAQQ